MKFIMVPPGASERLLAVLRAQSDTRELPPIAGMPVMVSRHCPPDTAYFLQPEAIPEIRPAPNHWADVWDEVEEPADAYRFQTFAIDYAPRMRKWNPPPPWTWKEKLKWRLWWWRIRALNLWHRFRWESRSPFRDAEFDPF